VHDEVTGATYTWDGSRQYVRLDPFTEPAHIFTVREV
jgi:starch synthase (maltosyl-transferring)